MRAMETKPHYQRPPFEDTLAAWKALLAKRGLDTDIVWILDENLCFERDSHAPGGFKLGFQTELTPHPPDAAKATYHHFAEIDARLAFFFPGGNDEIEEITDVKRWQQRVVRGRPLSAVDFCMTLAALRELKAHGRVLTPDERFGLKILRSMKRART